MGRGFCWRALSGSYELYGHDGYSRVHTFTFSCNMILSKSKKMLAVMPVYRRVGRYILLLHLLVLLAVYKHGIFTLSLEQYKYPLSSFIITQVGTR